MRVLITGATGFIGRALCAHLGAAGHDIVALSRNVERARDLLKAATVHAWEPLAGPAPMAAVDGADAVVHLAGESVAGRWSAAQRAAIRDSRVLGTRNLVDALGAASARPRVLVSASAIGFYGDRGDEELTESSDPGDDFLARTCQAWEAEANRAQEHDVTVIRLRTGIVLGRGGGALAEMLLPAKLGLSGPLGSGRQWWSWVHRDDVLGVVELALQQGTSRVFNTTAPEPIRQKEFARTMGRVLRRPAFLPAPAFAIRLALGGFSAELLSSKRVLPRAALDAGYEYRFGSLEPALREALG